MGFLGIQHRYPLLPCESGRGDAYWRIVHLEIWTTAVSMSCGSCVHHVASRPHMHGLQHRHVNWWYTSIFFLLSYFRPLLSRKIVSSRFLRGSHLSSAIVRRSDHTPEIKLVYSEKVVESEKWASILKLLQIGHGRSTDQDQGPRNKEGPRIWHDTKVFIAVSEDFSWP